jgi:hypothetical protein
MAEGSDIIAMRTPLLLMDVQERMFSPGNQLEIGRGVVQCVAVGMVDMFGGSQFPVQESLHDNSVFGFIVPFSNHDVPVAVLDVDSDEDFVTDWLAISPIEGVMVPTKSLGDNREGAPFDGTGGRVSVGFLQNSGVSIPPIPVIMGGTHALVIDWKSASSNRTMHKFTPLHQSYLKLDTTSTLEGDRQWLN